ncbi:MAG: hypothetical protein ACLFR1_16240 [Spirochaetia bacterium]
MKHDLDVYKQDIKTACVAISEFLSGISLEEYTQNKLVKSDVISDKRIYSIAKIKVPELIEDLDEI